MGFEYIDQAGWSPEVEHNPKMSISVFFWAGEGWQMGFESIDQPSQSSVVECNPKMDILFFGRRGLADGVWVHRPAQQSSEVECNPKMGISFFWQERVGRWGSSPSTSPANHQKLYVIQNWAFHIFHWWGVVDGVWVHRPAWLIIRSWK